MSGNKGRRQAELGILVPLNTCPSRVAMQKAPLQIEWSLLPASNLGDGRSADGGAGHRLEPNLRQHKVLGQATEVSHRAAHQHRGRGDLVFELHR